MNNKYKNFKKEDREALCTCLISAIISSIVAILALKYYLWDKSELSLLIVLLLSLLPLIFIFWGFTVFLKCDMEKEDEICFLKKWVSFCSKTTIILSVLVTLTLRYYISNKSQNMLLISLFFLFWTMAFCVITFLFRGIFRGRTK